MKKFLLLGAVATLGLTACKKDHTCTCTYDFGGTDVEYATTMNSKKAVAKAFCEGEGYEIVEVKVDGEVVDMDDSDDDSDSSCTLD